MDADDFEPTGPVHDEIQCSRCKYAATFEWDGKTYDWPEAGSCLKYPRDTDGKPEGILFKIVNIKDHQSYDEGHYIKCPFFEEK